MSEEKKSAPKATESKSSEGSSSKANCSLGQNGKGDGPRNCFSDTYRSNFDSIDWSK